VKKKAKGRVEGKKINERRKENEKWSEWKKKR